MKGIVVYYSIGQLNNLRMLLDLIAENPKHYDCNRQTEIKNEVVIVNNFQPEHSESLRDLLIKNKKVIIPINKELEEYLTTPMDKCLLDRCHLISIE